MTGDPYVTALNNALTEIQKAYPDITHSFIFANDGSIVAGNTEANAKTFNNLLESFGNLKEKTKTIGNITNFNINGKNGKLNVSSVNDMYLMLATNGYADDAQIYSLTHVVIPPLLKTLQTFAGEQNVRMNAQQNEQSNSPSNLRTGPRENTQSNVSKHLQTQSIMTLTVNPLSGFFDGDAVQIDEKTLNDWSDNEADGEIIDRVKVITLEGKSTICKVKKISVGNVKGKNFIRMPAKICSALKLKGGDRVNVKPEL